VNQALDDPPTRKRLQDFAAMIHIAAAVIHSRRNPNRPGTRRSHQRL
jgi:hypothetical protein